MADKIIQLSDGTDNMFPANKRMSIQINANTTTSVTNLSKYSHGILYGEFAGRAYSCPFDVRSIESGHQFYVSSSAYLNYTGSLANNTMTTSNVTGFTRIVVVLYT